MPQDDSGRPIITDSPRLWRKTNGIERIFCAMHHELAGCGRVVFVARFSGPAENLAIERALTLVSQHCPQAGVRVVRSPSSIYEYHLTEEADRPSIRFQTVRDADHGCAVAIELGRESFPEGTEPGLRWGVLISESDDSFQIVGLAHHALFDAFSMAVLLRRFLEVLGTDTLPQWNWPAPKIPRGQWKTIWKHYTRTIPLTVRQERLKKISPDLPRDADRTGACIIHRWTPEQTAALTRACREAGTTVTALLGVAGTQAVHTHGGRDFPVVDLVVPINLRRYLPEETAEQTVGNLVVIKNFSVDFRQPVELAKESRTLAAHLKDYLAYQSPLRVYHSVNLLVPQRFVVPVQKPIMVSANSMGRFDFPTSPSGVRILECGWFANGGAHMPVLSQSAATIDNRLSIMSYSVWIAPGRLRTFATEVDRLLREFAGVPSATAATDS